MAPIPSPGSANPLGAGSFGAAALGADFDPFTPDVIRDPQHYLMNRGRIALSGTGAELRTRKNLVQASYLGE